MKKLFTPLVVFLGRNIERRRFTDPPIYIGGCGRSGTTLLLSILSAHPDIFACPRELGLFFDASISRDGKLRTPKFFRLYRTLIRKKIKKSATRYCEKSPSNIYHVEHIERKHSGRFKLIHIIRDGRDVILSKHPRGKNGYWVEPERWVNDVSEGLKWDTHPNVLSIKYEDLVTDYERIIYQVSEFLNLELSDSLINWHEHATVRENNALFTEIKEINTKSIGRWKDPQYKERIEELSADPEANALLKKLKYQ